MREVLTIYLAFITALLCINQQYLEAALFWPVMMYVLVEYLRDLAAYIDKEY